MLISEAYLEQNRQLHASRPDYGSGGHRWTDAVEKTRAVTKSATVLDYGCGKGTLVRALGLRGIAVAGYDPAQAGYSERPEPADLVVCGDVLEHIEPECLDAVLDDLRALSGKAVFLVVSTVPSMKTLPDGRNTHQIVQPYTWWLPKLWSRWRIEMFNNDASGFLVVGVR